MADKTEVFNVTGVCELDDRWIVAGTRAGKMETFYTEGDPQVFPGDRVMLTGTEAGLLKSITWPDGRVSRHYPIMEPAQQAKEQVHMKTVRRPFSVLLILAILAGTLALAAVQPAPASALACQVRQHQSKRICWCYDQGRWRTWPMLACKVVKR